MGWRTPQSSGDNVQGLRWNPQIWRKWIFFLCFLHILNFLLLYHPLLYIFDPHSITLRLGSVRFRFPASVPIRRVSLSPSLTPTPIPGMVSVSVCQRVSYACELEKFACVFWIRICCIFSSASVSAPGPASATASAWLPFLGKWKKIDVPATRPAQPAGCLTHPQAEAGDGSWRCWSCSGSSDRAAVRRRMYLQL